MTWPAIPSGTTTGNPRVTPSVSPLSMMMVWNQGEGSLPMTSAASTGAGCVFEIEQIPQPLVGNSISFICSFLSHGRAKRRFSCSFSSAAETRKK